MTPVQQKEIEHIIWTKELAIFAGRAEGDMMPYVKMVHPSFLAWPAFAKEPIEATKFISKNSQPGALLAGEKIQLTSNGMSVMQDEVVSYFTTHRTRRPGNVPVDQRFENIHVWRMHQGSWKVVTSMSRAI